MNTDVQALQRSNAQVRIPIGKELTGGLGAGGIPEMGQKAAEESKDEIREYIVREFGYNLERTLNEIRPDYSHKESCQESVPESITAFLESTSFEDAVRNAVSLGGDTDTMACISGSIAEAFYQNSPNGLSDELKAQCREILKSTKHEEFLVILDRFEKAQKVFS